MAVPVKTRSRAVPSTVTPAAVSAARVPSSTESLTERVAGRRSASLTGTVPAGQTIGLVRPRTTRVMAGAAIVAGSLTSMRSIGNYLSRLKPSTPVARTRIDSLGFVS